MRISDFSRIDTVTVPDKFMSVIKISSGEAPDREDIRTTLEQDKDSLDYLGVASDTDPLDHPDLYKAIKSVRPRGLKVLIITDGRDPAVLDDLVGAGYVHAMDLLIGKELTPEQAECISIMQDNGCRFAVTIKASEHDDATLATIASACKGCSMFIIRLEKDRPVKRSELSALTSVAKTCTWNVKTA